MPDKDQYIEYVKNTPLHAIVADFKKEGIEPHVVLEPRKYDPAIFRMTVRNYRDDESRVPEQVEPSDVVSCGDVLVIVPAVLVESPKPGPKYSYNFSQWKAYPDRVERTMDWYHLGD